MWPVSYQRAGPDNTQLSLPVYPISRPSQSPLALLTSQWEACPTHPSVVLQFFVIKLCFTHTTSLSIAVHMQKLYKAHSIPNPPWKCLQNYLILFAGLWYSVPLCLLLWPPRFKFSMTSQEPFIHGWMSKTGRRRGWAYFGQVLVVLDFTKRFWNILLSP